MPKLYTFTNPKNGDSITTTHAKLPIAADEERARCAKAKKTAPRWTSSPGEYELSKTVDAPDEPEPAPAKKKPE